MAVAVKNREATSHSVLDRLPVQIALGVLYVVAGIAVAFPLPWCLWWYGLHLDPSIPGWWALLLATQFGLALAAVLGGRRLLGPHPPKELTVGIFAGCVGLFLIALIDEWLGLRIEDALYGSHYLGSLAGVVGVALTIGIGVLILVLAGSYFLSPKAEPYLKRVADQGWLAAAPYKRSQGMRVRRGTILGVLILAGTGVWALQRNLEKYGGDWTLSIPFTGQVDITGQNVGDVKVLQDALKDKQNEETARWQAARDRDLDTIKQLAARPLPPDVRERLADLASAYPDVQQVLPKLPAQPQGQELSAAEIKTLNEAMDGLRGPRPQARITVDRFELRSLNERFQQEYVKVDNPGLDLEPKVQPFGGVKFTPGQVVTKQEFNKEKDLRTEKRDQLAQDKDLEFMVKNVEPPTEGTLTPADGPAHYTSLIVLPKVMWTVPLILAALTLWFAWRLVNVPIFADFLIATEAELNKVSWTTRPRLIQDTIVVLTTVLLMAVFLFVADFAWSKLLQGIGVLQPPTSTSAPAEPKW